MPFSKKKKNIIESRQSLFYKKKNQKKNGNIKDYELVKKT